MAVFFTATGSKQWHIDGNHMRNSVALKIYRYERDQYCNMAEWLVDAAVNPLHANKVFCVSLVNAITENVGLHGRILCEFILEISKNNGRKSDIGLSDLLPDSVVSPIRGSQLWQELKKDYGKHDLKGCLCYELNKHLVHATEDRDDEKEWSDILTRLNRLLGPLLLQIDQALQSQTLTTADAL